MNILPKNILLKIYAYIFVFLVIFNPYTIVGPLGAIVLILGIAISFLLDGLKTRIPFPEKMTFLVAIGVYGSYVSQIYGIGQTGHLKVVLTSIITIIGSYSFSVQLVKRGWDFCDFLTMLNMAVLVNSLIIIFEFIFPSFRQMVELFLVDAGNRDWSKSFRYRGLASSGGAALSVLSAISVVISCHLYSINKLSATRLLCYLIIVSISCLFIGRSGLVLIAVLFPVWYITRIVSARFSFISLLYMSLLILTCIYLLWPLFESQLEERFGRGFFNYAFGFIFDVDSQERMSGGTLDLLSAYASSVPAELPYVLTGFGFYGFPLDFPLYTDSGVARVFLSVGFPLGLAFYVCYISIYKKFLIDPKYHFLSWSILGLLVIGEFKEPMLFSGYGSRLLILMLCFYLALRAQEVTKTLVSRKLKS